LLMLAALVAFVPAVAAAQTNDELNNDGRNTDNVTTQSMGLDARATARSNRSISRT